MVQLLYPFISGGYREGARGARPPSPPLFLDQTEARRAEKIFYLDRASPLSLDDRPPLSECPYPPCLCRVPYLTEKEPTSYTFH